MRAFRGYGLHLRFSDVNRTVLGQPAGEGESPVHESDKQRQDPEYRETRETLREVGGTTLQG